MAVLRRSSSMAGSSSSLSSPSSSDSELSELSDSPSPPSSPHPPPRSLAFRSTSSQNSSAFSSAKSSPAPPKMRPTPPVSDNDGPARKRRKISEPKEPKEPKERTTERLDLTKDGVENDPQLKRVMDVLQKKRKIVVIAGAGISVSAGIPDFRSSAGLFSTLRKEHGLKSSGKDLFDASVYKDDSSTSSFHDMVRSLSQKTKLAKPTPFHHLLATLAQEGRLLRLYTQNVDGIDTSLPPLQTMVPFPKKGPYPKTVQLHGGLDYMVCTKCHTLSDFDPDKFNGPVPPPCPQCVENDEIRQVAEKRSHGIGCLRPRMVLYNEDNPDAEAIGSVSTLDMRTRPDAVIVVGTSMKIPGVKRITREMCAIVRDRRDGVTMWINNDPEPSGKDFEDSWDIVVKGPCDEVARHAAMPRWDDHTTWKEATEDEVDKAKSQKPVVMVPLTPKKSAQLAQTQMLTPAASPRMVPLSLTAKPKASTPSKPSRKRKAESMASNAPATKAKAQVKAPAKRQPKKAAAKKKPQAANQKVTDMFTVSKSTVRTSTATKKDNTSTFINYGPKSEELATKLASKAEVSIPVISAVQKLAPVAKALPLTPRMGRFTRLKRPSMVDLQDCDSRVNRSTSPVSPEMEPFTSPPGSPNGYYTPPSYVYTTPDDTRPTTSESQKSDIIVPDRPPRDLRSLLHMA